MFDQKTVGLLLLDELRGKEDSKMIKKEKRRIKSKDKEKKEAGKDVEFTFYAPERTGVYLSGEFNQWDTRSMPMKKDKDGVWKIKIRLSPGRYEYKFFADNQWVEDLPGAEPACNPFGTQNYVVQVK